MDKTRQMMEETSGDRETRKEGDFHKVEQGLPKDIGSRSNIPMLDNASSFLGSHNPIAKNVDPETEEVWLLDNTAYRPDSTDSQAPQPFQAEFVAAYFKKNTGADVSKAVAEIADKIGLGKDDGLDAESAKKTIAERLLPFVQTIAPARSVDIKLPSETVQSLGPGGRSAVSEQVVSTLKDHKNGESTSINAVPDHVTPHGPMLTHFAEPEGWAVISGISTPPIAQTAYSQPYRY